MAGGRGTCKQGNEIVVRRAKQIQTRTRVVHHCVWRRAPLYRRLLFVEMLLVIEECSLVDIGIDEIIKPR